jgi:hypothetical protein
MEALRDSAAGMEDALFFNRLKHRYCVRQRRCRKGERGRLEVVGAFVQSAKKPQAKHRAGASEGVLAAATCVLLGHLSAPLPAPSILPLLPRPCNPAPHRLGPPPYLADGIDESLAGSEAGAAVLQQHLEQLQGKQLEGERVTER